MLIYSESKSDWSYNIAFLCTMASSDQRLKHGLSVWSGFLEACQPKGSLVSYMRCSLASLPGFQLPPMCHQLPHMSHHNPLSITRLVDVSKDISISASTKLNSWSSILNKLLSWYFFSLLGITSCPNFNSSFFLTPYIWLFTKSCSFCLWNVSTNLITLKMKRLKIREVVTSQD